MDRPTNSWVRFEFSEISKIACWFFFFHLRTCLHLVKNACYQSLPTLIFFKMIEMKLLNYKDLCQCLSLGADGNQISKMNKIKLPEARNRKLKKIEDILLRRINYVKRMTCFEISLLTLQIGIPLCILFARISVVIRREFPRELPAFVAIKKWKFSPSSSRRHLRGHPPSASVAFRNIHAQTVDAGTTESVIGGDILGRTLQPPGYSFIPFYLALSGPGILLTLCSRPTQSTRWYTADSSFFVVLRRILIPVAPHSPSERLPGCRRGPRRHSAGPRFFPKALHVLEYPDGNSWIWSLLKKIYLLLILKQYLYILYTYSY